ncbi:MAG: helix-turn-helix domain-containing protein [Oscillospiraceae bacterium]|nr:helix-turn-helix domain-containing protein [Oscillospiraceae bacterium]
MSATEYLSVTEWAAKYGKDRAAVNRLIHAGRIPAVKIGTQWAIPSDAVPPPDGRVKSGQYRD